jgi:hypothetical protein
VGNFGHSYGYLSDSFWCIFKMRRSAAPSQRSNSLLASTSAPMRSNADILALLSNRNSSPLENSADSTSRLTAQDISPLISRTYTGVYNEDHGSTSLIGDPTDSVNEDASSIAESEFIRSECTPHR